MKDFQKRIQKGLSGLLILALFVTLLSVSGSTVAVKAATSSYIVQGSDVATVVELVEAYGGTVSSELPVINGVGAALTDAAVAALRNEAAVSNITVNQSVSLSDVSLDKKVERPKQQVNFPDTDYPEVSLATEAWAEGYTGDGVTVAIIDTGAAYHQGIFVNGEGAYRIVGWKDLVEGKNFPEDDNGHGTHVAGIIANSQIGADGSYNGIAPNADLVVVRALDENGFGTYEDVIEGIQWVIENKNVYGIKVLNLSITGEVLAPYFVDPLNQAVTNAWANGITVVTAAGNGGPDPMSVGVPANNPYVITVGAFTDAYSPMNWADDYLAPFSAAGPTLDGFVKPDLLAPGAHMVSTMAMSSQLSQDHDANWVGTGRYFEMAGTSQAAAVVSGVAALMLDKNESLSPDQIKYRLMLTAMPWIEAGVPAAEADALYSIFQQGAGRVNAFAAVMADSDVDGIANYGMDIYGDLAGDVHYEGYAYYDEEIQAYRLHGFEDADLGAWSGGYGLWSGGYGLWSGTYGLWSEGLGLWSGGLGLWSGGYGLWSGGYGLWSGSEPWAETQFADEAFVTRYMAGEMPDSASTSAGIGIWVEE